MRRHNHNKEGNIIYLPFISLFLHMFPNLLGTREVDYSYKYKTMHFSYSGKMPVCFESDNIAKTIIKGVEK